MSSPAWSFRSCPFSAERKETALPEREEKTYATGFDAGRTVRTEYVHDEYGNMLEEHRIAVYAPEIRPLVKCSEKIIEQAWRDLKLK